MENKQSLNKKRILLIDDDEDIRKIYSETLSNAGFEIDSAVDGNAGFAKASEGGYDLILLDVMLPIIDGITFLSMLKKDPPKRPNGPIILLTSLSLDNKLKDLKNYKNYGASDYIIKSDYTPKKLVLKVKSIFENQV